MNSKIVAGLCLSLLTSFAAQASCLEAYSSRIESLKKSSGEKNMQGGVAGVSASATAGAGYFLVLAVPPVAVAAGAATVGGAASEFSALKSQNEMANLLAVRNLLIEAQVGTGLNIISLAEKNQSTPADVSAMVNDLDSKNVFCPGGDVYTGEQVVDVVLKTMAYAK